MTATPATRAAIYGRFSSEMQNPRSADDQLDFCKRFAAARGIVVVATFKDEALSGAKTTTRRGYQDLLAAARTKPRPFDVILVESLDRLTRDNAELLRLDRELRSRRIKLVGISDGVDSGQKGSKLMTAVRGAMNEAYRDDLSEKVRRGQDAIVRRGLFAGGRCYGYRAIAVEGEGNREGRPRKRIAVDEAQAAIVRRIYREYAEGCSLMTIVHRLNAERVLPPLHGTRHAETRKAWAVTSVHYMLRNPIYTGRVVWNRRQFFDGDNEKRQATVRPEAEHIVREDPSLRIVPPELAQAVAARHAMWRDRYGAGRGRNNAGVSHVAHSRRYLLTGMLRCGTCNGRMVAVTTTKRQASGGRWERGWYYCAAARTKGPTVCAHTVRYRKDAIESALTSRAMEAVNRKNVAALVDGVNAALKRMAERATGREEALRTELAEAEAERERWLEAIGSGADTFASVREKLAAVEEKIAAATADLERARFEKRNVGTPAAIPARAVTGYLRGIRRMVKTDVPKAKAAILGLLDGDLVLTPAGAGEPARVTGRFSPSGLAVSGHTLRGSATTALGQNAEPLDNRR